MNPFESSVFQEISAALKLVSQADVPDIYVLSLHVFDLDDDPRRPVIQLGYNTNAQVRASTPSDDPGPGCPFASNAKEARWNFAFWLQNELLFIGEPGTTAGNLLEEQLKTEQLWYSDEDIVTDEAHTYELDPQITARFITMLVRVVQELHATGSIAERFGRPIPVLVHELEYHDAIARQNAVANPDGLTADFAAWIGAGAVSR